MDFAKRRNLSRVATSDAQQVDTAKPGVVSIKSRSVRLRHSCVKFPSRLQQVDTPERRSMLQETLSQTVVPDPRWDFNFRGDYTQYPRDVWEYLIEFCVLWNFSAPMFSRKSKEGSRAVMWLNALRELQEVCAEFGLEALRDYRKEFERYMQEHDGIAPHIVVSPKSLLNVIAGHVAIMRNRSTLQIDRRKEILRQVANG